MESYIQLIILNQRINWFLNLKSKNPNIDTSLFLGSPLTMRGNNVIVSTGNSLHNYNSLSGLKIWEKKYIYCKSKEF